MYLPLHYMSVISGKDIISPPDSRVGVSGLARLKPNLSASEARADVIVHERRLIGSEREWAERAAEVPVAGVEDAHVGGRAPSVESGVAGHGTRRR